VAVNVKENCSDMGTIFYEATSGITEDRLLFTVCAAMPARKDSAVSLRECNCIV